jgi:HEPN domain-containing protein
MEHSRVNLSKFFLSMAEEDLEIAKVLLTTEHYAGSVFHSQQCIEKAIKSVLILFGQDLDKSPQFQVSAFLYADHPLLHVGIFGLSGV